MTGCENRFQWHLVSSSSHGSQSEPSSSPTAAGSWWASSALPVITPLAYKRGAGRWRRGEEERRGGERRERGEERRGRGGRGGEGEERGRREGGGGGGRRS
jgi:hypothetical protein